MPILSSFRPVALTALAAVVALAACTPSPDPASLDWDPFEARNRQTHARNVAFDRAAFGPVSRAYGRTVPAPVRSGISNFRENWLLPHHTVQYLLQGRPGLAVQTTGRFVINTVVGIAGILDPATPIGIPYRYTSVDETMHVWGVPEGAYIEMPLGGPGAERDWSGWALDFVADPLIFVLPPAAFNTLLAAGGLDLMNERYTLDPTINALLHESADSYTALRISYLQAARARLADGVDLDLLEDIYAE